MNVSITFEPSGISGLVAQGTYLIDAARRLGVTLGTGCTSGQGECPACVVVINSGVELLSHPSIAETRQLGNNPFGQTLRLACQTKIEGLGDIIVGTNAERPRAPTPAEDISDIQRKFSDLPLKKKIATLLQFEAVTMSEAFDSAIQKPLELGSRLMDRVRPAHSSDDKQD